MRGGESVLRALAEIFPQADLFTHVHKPGLFDPYIGGDIHTTFIDKLPLSKKAYPLYLPFMFSALESLDLSDYDLIISSESGPAKGIIPAPGARHICYVHSPMRYLWDQRLIYRRKVPAAFRFIFDTVTEDLRQKDVLANTRVDRFVANSNFVKSRIETYYRRDAAVIHPPVSLDDLETAPVEDFYLFAGHAASYKRLDLAVGAAEALKKRLIVAGDVPAALRQKHESRHVSFLGRVERAQMVKLMAQCRALLFPGVEDFGIIPVEVMGCGRPVIAYGKGGILDSVVEGSTGLFFHEPTVEALSSAILAFEQDGLDGGADACRQRARDFAPDRFREKFLSLKDSLV
jgi:glycosyltransferase involved in cell wall biosynthesis